MSTKQKTRDEPMTTEQEIPVLTVDEAASVEDRLTPAVQNQILPSRYLEKDSDGNVTETPAELFERVADNIATAEYQFAQERGLSRDEQHEIFEEWRDEFEDLMKTQRFMPNSPTLMNAGLPLQQLSACFLISPKDDLEDIAQTEKEWTMVQKTGGGMGGAFHHLRPKGTLISTTKGVSSGPVSFMTKFDQVAGVIKQGGKRRGAQMAIMRVDHPDIGRFAVCKRREGDFDNFNISTGITDEFKEAVQNDEQYTLYAPQSDFEEPFEYVEETVNFYSPKKQEAHENVVDENLWRDYADDIEAWDWENEETISFREKWEDRFEKAAENGSLAVGEPMQLPARFIWDILIDGAWRNGEPGLFYLDETNRKHSFDVEEHPEYYIDATNPSLVAGTQVLTDNGVVPIESLEDTTFKTRSLNDNWAEASCWKSGTDQELYEITTNTGFTHEATPQHEWPVVSDGTVSKKRSDKLEEGDWVPLTETDSLEYGDVGEYSDGLLIGWLYGDGNITERAEDNRADFQYGFTISQEDANAGILDFIVQKLKEITGTEYSPTKRNRGGEDWYEIHVCNEDIVEYMDSFDVSEKSSGIPDSIWSNASEKFRKGFVDGLFSADGCVSEQDGRVTLTTSRSQIAEDIVSLLSFYGVKAQQRESVSELDGEEYERHDVTISNTPALRFRELFKFSHDNKQQSLESLSENDYTTVKSNCVKIESVKKSDRTAGVWDISVLDESHTFPIAGITTGNCAEQPLCEYEACNLGHINLSLMLEEDAPTYDEWRDSIDYNYTSESAAVYDYFEEAVDFDQFDRTIESGTRFLDNVVTMSEFPLEKIEERVRNMRKIGLGVMGWAQMCYQMGIRYGSDSSFELGRIIMSYIDETATKYSHKLAEERGTFEVWEKSKYANPTEYPEWFKSHAYDVPELWEDGYPMRNHNVTTVAPTGTTSMLGDTSGGIEPVHAVAFAKNVGEDIRGDDLLMEYDKVFLNTVEANEEKIGMTVDEMKQLIREQIASNEFEGIHGLPVPDWMKEKFVTTDRLTSEEHGKMQRVFQEGVDSGISKTVNLPKHANHADVHEAYMLALADDEIGAPIKGLTVYRDQSREKQVVTTQQYSDIEIENAVDMFDDLEEYAVIQEDDLPEGIDPDTFTEEVLGELNWKQKLNLSTETNE